MNLWVNRIGLILGLALFVFACEEPGEINLGLNPEQENFVAGSMDIPIEVSVGIAGPYIVSDTLLSTGALLVGKNTDPRFGSVEIEAYAQPWLLGGKVKVANSAQLNSIRLILNFENFYGFKKGITGSQKITVHELIDSINVEKSLSNMKYEFGDPLAEYEFELDSLVSSLLVSRSLPLDFGQQIFTKFAAVDSVINDDYILSFFKGLAFVPNESNDMLFNISTQAGTSLVFKYQVENVADSFRLVFTNNQSYYVDRDFSGTDLENIVIGGNTDTNTQYGYLNSLLGVYTELDFSPLFSLRDSIGKLVINRADISFSTVGVDSIYGQPAAINVFDKRNIIGFEHFPFFQHDNIRISRFGNSYLFRMVGSVNSTNKTILYPFPALEQYLQSVIKVPDLFNDELKFVLIPSGYGRSFNQLVFNKDNVKLKLYYSYLKDQPSSTD